MIDELGPRAAESSRRKKSRAPLRLVGDAQAEWDVPLGRARIAGSGCDAAIVTYRAGVHRLRPTLRELLAY